MFTGRRFRLAGLLVILRIPAAPLVGGMAGSAAPTAEFVGVHPNPRAPGDPGEWVAIRFPEPTNVTGWSLDDGETRAWFPARTVAGRVIATTEPEALPSVPPNATVVELRGRLALANDGETVALRSDRATVDRVTYPAAPEGRDYVPVAGGWEWRIPGTTDRPVVTARDVPATLFVLPDAPQVAVEAIDGAEDRILLAAYTFASPRIGEGLCAARRRGVSVAVLLEGDPIGGMTARQSGALDALEACGIPLHVLGGPGDRYAVHHAKYAVIDDRALVVSENWKPAGVGGRSSRGWGVLVDSPRVADALEATFRADADYRDARPWEAVRPSLEFVEEPSANGSFPTRFEPRRVSIDRVDVLLTPDNAEGALVGLIDGAEGSIAVQQVTIGDADGPFIGATRRAAARGVTTRVLLSSAWYVAADNRAMVEGLNTAARRDGLPLRARLITPRSRFEKSHVKGLLVDDTAAVGSLNWNAHAARRNREVMLLLHDPDAAAYYGRVHAADWRGGTWRLPVGFAGAVALTVVAAAVWLARSVEFGDGGALEDGSRDVLPVHL